MDSEPMPIIVAAPVAQLDPESGPIVGGEPYYKARPNIAPINAKWVRDLPHHCSNTDG